MHLTEMVETYAQRHHWRAPIVLCGATDLPDPGDSEPDGCLGCADCLRYCRFCVDEVTRRG